ncbi:MAG: 4-hydroxybutyrate CoA-transferase [Spirochaetes bacterium]|nr:4-hydroxybutyrate CoA-transferase [Spirochaetota bacterium]
MSDWKKLYKERVTSADEAVKHIKSGDRVFLAHATGESLLLTEAMVRNAASYEDVEIVHMVAMGKGEYCKPEHAKNFRHNALFVGTPTRQAVAEGRGDFTPVFIHHIPGLLETTLKPDVVLLQLSPPNEEGYCSFGISVDYTKPAAENAKITIAQINKNMPFTLGDSLIHVSKLDHIVEHDSPLIELKPPTLGETEIAIGKNCASLVRNGDCLQLGIGGIPDAVLAGLTDKNDLGIHTEMFSDGVVDLARKGIVNNARKNFNTGKFISAFLMGTRKLYDFVDKNPEVEMHPFTYCNNPIIAGKNDNLVSINSCVQVDLMGQVVSDCIGELQISGVGGQVDFVRAASFSKGGRSILAMPSCVKGKGVSKIVPFIDHGAAVTTSRFDVDYIVTEFGIAHLRGQTLRERAFRLIEIAHPDFRDGLKKEFERRFHRSYPSK